VKSEKQKKKIRSESWPHSASLPFCNGLRVCPARGSLEAAKSGISEM